MLLVYALVEAPGLGWTSTKSLIYFGISLLALVLFVFNERRAAHPLMPLRIFKIRNLSGADSLMLLVAAGLFSVFFFTTLYLQDVLGYSAVRTGLDFFILPVAVALAATNVPRLIKKIGYKPILIVAPLIVAAGLFWISFIPVHGTYWGNVAPGMILMGLGMGTLFVSVTITATSGVPQHEAGLASGLLNTSQQIGGSLGLAILTGVATSVTTAYLNNLHLRHAASRQIIDAASVHGFHYGYLIAASFGVAASILAILVIRTKDIKGAPDSLADIAAAA
jgi:MFS family permease